VLPAWACGGLLAAAGATALGHAPLLTAVPPLALLVAAWAGPAGRVEVAVIGVIGVVVATDLLGSPAGVVQALLPTAEVPDSPWVWLYAAGTLGWAAWALTEGRVGRSLAPALGLALTVAPLQTATLSDHLSRAGVVAKWRSVAGEGEPLLGYKLGHARDPFAAGPDGVIEPIERLGDLRKRLVNTQGRVFALVRTPDLVVVDGQFRRTTDGHVAVLDRSSAKVVLISNQLGPGEVDLNLLASAVRSSPPEQMGTRSKAVLDGVVALLGADVSSTEVARGGSFEVTLHFAVRGSPARRWRVFLHMDRGGHRVPSELTDHDPVGGVFGTERWQAGDHVADTHRIVVPWLSTPPGTYRLYAGLHQGDSRAAVTPTEASEGQDRVFIGEIRVNSW